MATTTNLPTRSTLKWERMKEARADITILETSLERWKAEAIQGRDHDRLDQLNYEPRFSLVLRRAYHNIEFAALISERIRELIKANAETDFAVLCEKLDVLSDVVTMLEVSTPAAFEELQLAVWHVCEKSGIQSTAAVQ